MTRRGAKLGQHFLIHSWPAIKLAHAASPQEGETLLEIGPGKGILTRELLKFAPVVAVEKDGALTATLREMFADDISSGRLKLICADIRDITPEHLGLTHYILAANIPYYITGEIIRQFLTAKDPPRMMALMVQKEVARRIVARKESILSLSVKAYGVPRIVAKVSRRHFSPSPNVDSAILVIENISKDLFANISEEDFFKVVHAGFASKRKMLAGNLARVFEKERVVAALARCGVPEKARAEDVGPIQWKQLAHALVR